MEAGQRYVLQSAACRIGRTAGKMDETVKMLLGTEGTVTRKQEVEHEENSEKINGTCNGSSSGSILCNWSRCRGDN